MKPRPKTDSPDELVVRGGLVVLEAGRLRADVLVQQGRVSGLLQRGSVASSRARVVDASGCLVLPGGVDAHTHVGISFGEFKTRDDFTSATRAAAVGGTTCLLEFAFPEPDEDPAQAVERRIEEAAGRALVDYGFHAAVARKADTRALAALGRAARLGAPSVKVFTAYRGLMMLELGDLFAVMREAGRQGCLVMVHAETEALVERATVELKEQGLSHARYHPRARPPTAELDAARSILGLARQAGAAVYLVHVTLPEVAAEIAAAQVAGVRAFGETCPHYLLLDESAYQGPHPERFVCSPPLRSASAARGLWRYLGRELGGIHSDHCCFDSAQKAVHANDSARVPPGLPGIETRLPLMVSAALAGRLSLEQVASLCSAAPARLFGLSQKGSLLPGADADLVVVDPRAETVIEGEKTAMATDYSPFEGFRLRGRIRTVVAQGRVLVEDGQWTGEAVGGRFLRRRGLGRR